ncbi:collagen alpha-1(I) chain-like [Melospiza melodia melodia]|uniref:collagen alpha-1(I) chain-like n=1 Tax=Melospiza melodia melodia TaxID=1914991 RepID=UPI002FD477E7
MRPRGAKGAELLPGEKLTEPEGGHGKSLPPRAGNLRAGISSARQGGEGRRAPGTPPSPRGCGGCPGPGAAWLPLQALLLGVSREETPGNEIIWHSPQPPHLALPSQSSLRCLPAWPSPSGRPIDGKPRASLWLALPTPNYIFGLTKLPCHSGPHASTAPRTGKPRAALSHVRRGARPAGAEGQGGAAPRALPAGRGGRQRALPAGRGGRQRALPAGRGGRQRALPAAHLPAAPDRALLGAGSAEPGPPGAGALPAPRAGSAAPCSPRPAGAPVTPLLRRLPSHKVRDDGNTATTPHTGAREPTPRSGASPRLRCPKQASSPATASKLPLRQRSPGGAPLDPPALAAPARAPRRNFLPRRRSALPAAGRGEPRSRPGTAGLGGGASARELFAERSTDLPAAPRGCAVRGPRRGSPHRRLALLLSLKGSPVGGGKKRREKFHDPIPPLRGCVCRGLPQRGRVGEGARKDQGAAGRGSVAALCAHGAGARGKGFAPRLDRAQQREWERQPAMLIPAAGSAVKTPAAAALPDIAASLRGGSRRAATPRHPARPRALRRAPPARFPRDPGGAWNTPRRCNPRPQSHPPAPGFPRRAEASPLPQDPPRARSRQPAAWKLPGRPQGQAGSRPLRSPAPPGAFPGTGVVPPQRRRRRTEPFSPPLRGSPGSRRGWGTGSGPTVLADGEHCPEQQPGLILLPSWRGGTDPSLFASVPVLFPGSPSFAAGGWRLPKRTYRGFSSLVPRPAPAGCAPRRLPQRGSAGHRRANPGKFKACSCLADYRAAFPLPHGPEGADPRVRPLHTALSPGGEGGSALSLLLRPPRSGARMRSRKRLLR